MFWGLIMEPGKKYSQTVEKSFHVAHAALDINTAVNEPVQVLLCSDNRNYLICTLQKQKTLQVALDLNFQTGEQVSFATSGNGHVHLTGYIIEDDDLLNEEEDDEDEEVPELVPAKLGKRKANEKLKKFEAKRSKTAELLNEMPDTDDSDDSDVNLTDLLEEEEAEEEEEDEDDEEEDGVEEEEEDDDDEEDEEEAEDDSDEEEEETEVQKPSKKELPKQNGIVSKKDKIKLKQKLMNENQEANEKVSKKEKRKADKVAKQNDLKKSPGKSPGKQKTVEGGVIIEDLKEGTGNVVKPGKVVYVYYEGRLKSNNKMFDSHKGGNGFRFRVGKSEVIRGWDVGVVGMKVGGKRRVTCPPNMAYGAQGSPPTIPPNSILVFEIELKSCN